MRGDVAAAAVVLAVSAVLSILVAAYTPTSGGGGEGARGLLVVVTFPDLVSDVKQLLCPGDRVVSLVPPGVDPHEYQLTPSDAALAERASLVVSTGHAPFEVRLRSIVPRDRLVEIPRIPGIVLLRNPDTGQPNLHMPIYDPTNYVRFITYLAKRLAQLNPRCGDTYLAKAKRIAAEVEDLEESAPRLSAPAVGSLPPTQYAVEWLGLHERLLLVPEPGVAPTQGLLEEARSLLRGGAVAVILVDSRGEPLGKPDAVLADMARSLGSPVIKVPAPFINGTIPSKLAYIEAQVEKLTSGRG